MFLIFFFNDTATTEIYTLSLHDALPIFAVLGQRDRVLARALGDERRRDRADGQLPVRVGLQVGAAGVRLAVDREVDARVRRSEEHTSELQSRQYLVCRLLLEKKK